MNKEKKDRLIELLTDETLFGLDESESIEFNQLKKHFPEWRNDNSFELAAASISLNGLDMSEKLPANLRERILANADNFFVNSENARNIVNFPTKAKESVSASTNIEVENSIESKQPFWQWFGWGVAALACVALAVNLWLSNSRAPQNDVALKTPEIVQTPTPEFSAAQKRELLITTAADVVKTSFTAPKDEKQILGDIVWSNERQTGFMRFRGLPANNPSRESYQLWIVDEAQNPKTPISGGVFDVDENGEETVPINAQINVKKPKAFVVTKEKPGGVVVSKQEEVMAIAKI